MLLVLNFMPSKNQSVLTGSTLLPYKLSIVLPGNFFANGRWISDYPHLSKWLKLSKLILTFRFVGRPGLTKFWIPKILLQL